MSAPPLRHLICGAPGSGKTVTLVAHAARMIVERERAPRMLALSTEQRSVQRLRVLLQDQVVGGVPTADVWRRAVSLLEQFPQVAGLAPNWKSTAIISALDRRFLMQRAWTQAGNSPQSLYARYGDAPGALDWLVRVFDRFAEWSGTADPHHLSRSPQDAALAELWTTYRVYLRMSQQFGLVAFQEVLPRALDILRDEQTAARIRPDVLLLDDLDLFRPAELLFARGLVGPETTVVATSSRVPGEHDPDPAMRSLHAWCAELVMHPVHIEPTAHNHLREQVLYAHATVDSEAAAIARAASGAIRGDVEASDCAIVLFDQELDAPLRRACARYGLRVVGGERRDAYTLALAPLVLMGMRLIAGNGFTPADVLAFVRHPLLEFPPADLHLFAVAVEGLAGPHIARADDPVRMLQQLWPSESSEAGAQRLDDLVMVTMQAREVDLEPSVKLKAWLQVLSVDVRASAWTHQMLEPWAAEADATLLTRWFAFLEQSEQVHAIIGEPLGDRAASDILEASQGLVEPITDLTPNAVQLWSPHQLGGWSAHRVWLAGLHERALPQPPSALPWAPWTAYAAAFATLPGFVALDTDDRAARWAEAQHVLARAIGRGRDLVTLSWSTTGRDGRRRLPSPVLRTMSDEPMAPNADDRLTITATPTAEAPDGFLYSELPYIRPDAVFSTSPSAIENYLRCPRQYFYARELQLFDVVSSARQAFGQVVHAALREMKQRGDRMPNIMGLLDGHWSSMEGRFGTRLRAAAYREMAVDALRQVAQFDQERRNDGLQFVAAEAQFHWRIAPGVELRGTIDRIDRGPDGLSVVDYKLGAESPSINKLLELFAAPNEPEKLVTWRPSDLQLPLYALALEHGTVEGYAELADERVDEIGLVYPLQLYGPNGKSSTTGRRMLKVREHHDNCVVCTAPRGRSPATGEVCRAQLNAVMNEALAVVGAMQSGMIDPVPAEGPNTCRSCAFRTICPEPQA